MSDHEERTDDPPTDESVRSGRERRRFTRVNAPVPVTLTSHNNFYAGVNNDISEGGIFIVTKTPPSIGTFVELGLVLEAGGEPIPIRGVVRWQRFPSPNIDAPPGVGIQFLDLADEVCARLRAFVAQRDTLLWET